MTKQEFIKLIKEYAEAGRISVVVSGEVATGMATVLDTTGGCIVIKLPTYSDRNDIIINI